ncbi:MAG: archease [Pseudomonadota bacterium]
MSEERWEHFSHEADLGIRGYGKTVADAFAQGAIAMSAAITDPSTVRAENAVRIRCKSTDLELLFTDWLNALIYEMAVRRMLFCRFDVVVDGTQLKATAWGEAMDRSRHEPAVEVKGATYTALCVRRQKNGIWLAQCVIDV